MDLTDYKNLLVKHNLKVTPQRLTILEAIMQFNNHPTADMIIDKIKVLYPHIAVGTVYKTLDTFAQKGLITKVKTERDVMRYDPIVEPHHHLYDSETDQIEDYVDHDLDTLISDYFQKKHGLDFKIQSVSLHINCKLSNQKH
jgi:Fur family peroxide stress response transcriptional regulator